MPMTAQGMADAMTTAQGPAEDGAKQAAANLALATGIVGYIQANATIPAGIAVATTGSPSAQTGATTAPGTIT